MSTLSAPTGLLIGGEWVQTERRLAVMDPATFTVLAEVGDASVAEGLDAVSAAWDGFSPAFRINRRSWTVGTTLTR